ncbi:putative transferase CAF17-like protein [Dinothrombium tinctorium]|uniref:Putative transferase CAF17-like protein n=1 Tax=Dinothrombium tinctorium TaxID=1965070 RepID=A0A443QL22_9ACAR|nr:putative transferase CAF17-like protein [Dinothrombium tinctorium]
MSFRFFPIFAKNLKLHKYYSTVCSEFNVSKLTNKAFLRLSGVDAFSFVQTFVTNDIRRLQNDGCIYGFVLNINSRILADLFIYRLNDRLQLSERELVLNETSKDRFVQSKGDSYDQLLIECDSNLCKSIAKTFFAHKLRKDVKIEFANEYSVWAVFPNNILKNQHLPSFQLTSNDFIFVRDPRLTSFGYRFVAKLNSNHLNTSSIVKNMVHSQIRESNLRDYRRYRFKLGIAEGFDDFGHARMFILESNAHLLNATNDRKGLFIGEKMTSRILKSEKIRRRIMPIKFERVNSDVFSGSLITSFDERPVGSVVSVDDKYGLALLSSSHAEKECELLHPHSKQLLSTHIPFWWSLENNSSSQGFLSEQRHEIEKVNNFRIKPE